MPRGTAGQTRINDMNENSYLKISMVALFLAFAAISCWATAESLHLLLPDWPVAAAWTVTVGFFFIASWGTKMITDSLNQDIYMEHRGLKLLGGILIVLVFWLVCSMPTNTHTFYYRSHVNEEVTQDITTTKAYLEQIKDGTVTANTIKKDLSEFDNKVDVKLGELEAEIKNEANPGFGEKAKSILHEFAELLSVPKIEPLTYRSTSVQARQALYNAYREKIYILAKTKKLNIIRSLTPPNNNHKNAAKAAYNNLRTIEKAIKEKKIDLNDAEDMKEVCNILDEGYSTINLYNQFVNFKKPEDEATYTAKNPQTKVRRVLSVFDVWDDFLAGKTGGLHFTFWIFISVLIDIAAFVFFDIAFKKRD